MFKRQSAPTAALKGLVQSHVLWFFFLLFLGSRVCVAYTLEMGREYVNQSAAITNLNYQRSSALENYINHFDIRAYSNMVGTITAMLTL